MFGTANNAIGQMGNMGGNGGLLGGLMAINMMNGMGGAMGGAAMAPQYGQPTFGGPQPGMQAQPGGQPQQQVHMVYCSSCARKFPSNMTFCPHCGRPAGHLRHTLLLHGSHRRA